MSALVNLLCGTFINKLHIVAVPSVHCPVSSGISRFTEGSGRLLCSGTETRRGVQLRQPPRGHFARVRPALALQLFDNIRGGRRSQAGPSGL